MKSPLVIGYRGEIGKYLFNGVITHMPKPFNIHIYDMNASDDEVRSRLTVGDVIFLCVPLESTLTFFNKYQHFLRGKTVIEQTSLKLWVPKMKTHLKEKYNCTLLSMHVLFRPSATPDVKDHVVALINKKEHLWRKLGIISYVRDSLKAEILYIESIDEHETLMAVHQALVHRVLLTLNQCLISSFPGTYISKNVKSLAKRILAGDPKLYEMIQNNPKLEKQIENFNRKMKSFDIMSHYGRK